ncbi:MAG: Crp/Fnr family transcriptional regulator [Butyricicoccus sp.]
MDIRQFCMDFFGIQDRGLLDEMEQICKVRRVSKGDVLVQIGEKQSEAAFLISGLFRGYYVDSEGKEVTDCFAYRRGDFVMCCYSINDVARITLEALEESEIFCMPIHDIDVLIEQYPEISRLMCCYLTKALQIHWNCKVALTRLSATERYQWFLQTYPELIHLVKKKHVASFLNLTPQTLSQQRRNERQGVGVGPA